MTSLIAEAGSFWEDANVVRWQLYCHHYCNLLGMQRWEEGRHSLLLLLVRLAEQPMCCGHVHTCLERILPLGT